MTKKPILLILLAAVGALTVFVVRERRENPPSPVAAAMAKVEDFDREKLKGSYYLLHFWAKWCEPCAEEIPHLVEFAKNAAFQKPFRVVAVSLDPTIEEAQSMFPEGGRNLPPNFLLAMDRDRDAAEAMGSFQYPETYFVGPDGKVIEKWVGARKWQQPEVTEYFQKMIR